MNAVICLIPRASFSWKELDICVKGYCSPKYFYEELGTDFTILQSLKCIKEYVITPNEHVKIFYEDLGLGQHINELWKHVS